MDGANRDRRIPDERRAGKTEQRTPPPTGNTEKSPVPGPESRHSFQILRRWVLPEDLVAKKEEACVLEREKQVGIESIHGRLVPFDETVDVYFRLGDG